MTLTQAPAGAAEAATARHGSAGDLFDAGMYFEAHPGARLPVSPVINIRAVGANYAEKVADLHAIAASWDAPVITLAEGTLYTEIVFGQLTYEAHVPPADRGVFAYEARMQRAGAEAA